MAFADRINESIRGRNLGFEFVTSGKHGSTQGGRILAGPDAYRESNTTAETTSKNLRAFGNSVLVHSSAGSSQVWQIDPPIPGVSKTVVFASTATPQYLRLNSGSTVGDITIITATQGTTKTVISSSANGAQTLQMVGVTTAVWAVVPSAISSGVLSFTTST